MLNQQPLLLLIAGLVVISESNQRKCSMVDYSGLQERINPMQADNGFYRPTFVRRSEEKKVYGFSSTTISRLISKGLFPGRVKIQGSTGTFQTDGEKALRKIALQDYEKTNTDLARDEQGRITKEEAANA